LLDVVKERPLREAMTIRTGKRRGQVVGKVREQVREQLERLGRERSLMYKTMVLTGLRRGELADVRVCDLELTGPLLRINLPADVAKNRKAAQILLRDDLASDLGEWLKVTGKAGVEAVFRVPVELVKILKRDLKLAGIPYRDEQGRTLDVHALRHTTATFLSRAKVPPAVAQRIMRHSDIKLTLQVYTDVQQLDEAEAIAAMPALTRCGDMKPSDPRRSPNASDDLPRLSPDRKG
jgi:integrase